MVIEIYPPLALNEKGKRSENEDFVHPPIAENGLPAPSDNKLFIVCDGLGGAEKGEEASKIVCNTFAASLKGLDIVYEHDFERALEMAETRIDEYVEAHPEAEGMATTLALLALDEEGAKIVHIGDSRVYHIRNGQILFKTYDHSLVNEMVTSNIITEAEAINHPKKNVVSRAIMSRTRPTKLDLTVRTDVQPGDYFFLCTDGVLEGISDGVLCSIVSKQAENSLKINEVLDVCQAISKDNFSAYLIQVKAATTEQWNFDGGNGVLAAFDRTDGKSRVFPKWVAYLLILLSLLTILTILMTFNSLW